MTSIPSQSPAVTCRRCSQPYLLPAHVALPSCPRCGAAYVPLLRRLRDNRNAAALAFLALPVLTIGILTPFISMSQFGYAHAYSLLAGIRELYTRGNTFIASILLTFSVIFPYAKLLALLIATTRLLPLSRKLRSGLHKAATLTGKYSLLDLLVVAVIIVVIKFDGIADARALPGTYWFAAAVFLSIAAGICTDFSPKPSTHP